ncbi:MAG: hypothetical protein A2Y17_13335 [Clostridiales bacterium GWF2_38_85]|jgi:hypothetical protein|nr:MAG: hypothetical protein A2Y17_13335 [Clostridiales bacterium GWF2_38_85]
MTNSGDAAEQIVRISLEGTDYAIRIIGSGAKNIAAFLLAAFKSDGTDGKTKLKGKERLVNMLKSGKETKIFAIKNSDLSIFAKEAKRYGVVYCVLKDKNGTPNGTAEIMAKAEDASKISRIMDRLEFAAVPLATVETTSAEREVPDIDDTDKMLDELLSDDGKVKTDQPEADKSTKSVEKEQPENPTLARSEAERPSEPRSEMQSLSAEDTRATKKPKSVKEFLRERTALGAKKQQDKQPDLTRPETKATTQKTPQHQQPQSRGRKNKSNKKERG